MNYDPPTINSNVFNTSYFTDLNGNLTLEASDLRYVKKNNGYATGLLVDGLNIINSLTYNNALVDLSSISGVSAGIGLANKALILDSGMNITGIQGLCLGSSTDTSRYLSLLVDTLPVGNTLYGLTYGYDSTNQAEFGYFYNGPNSTSNALTFGFYNNSNILRVNNDQSVDIPFHNGTTGLKLNGTLITASADELNYNDITTLGVAQSSKTLTMNSTGLLRIGAGTVTGSNQIKWFNNTSLRCSIRMYRTSDTTPLIIADQIDLDRSTNRTYPILSVVSCPTTTGTTNGTPIGGISATTASLFNLKMNDAGFGTTNFDVGFSYGFTQPFASGYPNVQTLTTDGDALNIVVGSSNGIANTGNLLIDGVNKRTIFNSLTPSQATHTLNGSIFCKGGTGWTTGSYEILSRFESANGGNRVDIQCSTVSGDPCWIGTVTNSELRLGVNNSTKMTIDTSGYVGIGTSSPRCPLEISTSQLVALNLNMLSTVYRKRTDSNTLETSTGTVNYQFSLWLSEYLYCKAVAMVSDKRLKTDIKDIDFDYVSKFYDLMQPKSYLFKSNLTKPEFGFIAQEVVKAGYIDLISMMPNEELKIEDSEVDIDGVQLCLDYQKITMFNATMIKAQSAKLISFESLIKNMSDKIKELEGIIDKLTAKPALNKWLQRSP